MEDEINLLDYWNVIWKRRLLVISVSVGSVVLALVVSLMMPKYYESTTVVMTAESSTGGLGAALSALPFAGVLAGAAGIQTPADRIVVILKSRTIAEAVIHRFNLLRVFNEDEWDESKNAWKDPTDPPLLQDAVKFLTEDVMSVSKSKEGAITLTVEWKDPRLAADIANYYISALASFLNDNSINVNIQVVDRAVPAERESRPKIGLNMAIAGMTGFFCSIFLIFLIESIEKQRQGVYRQ